MGSRHNNAAGNEQMALDKVNEFVTSGLMTGGHAVCIPSVQANACNNFKAWAIKIL